MYYPTGKSTGGRTLVCMCCEDIIPNPVKDILHITTNLTDYTAAVYAMDGKLIKSSKASANHSLDYSDLAPGIYILKLSQKQTLQTFKIIKQ